MLTHIILLTLVVELILLAANAAPPVDNDVITADNSTVSNLLQIKVYYETLCSDSMQFIRGQLYHAMIDNNWLQYTDLQFVPYGKITAWTDPANNITTLYCQHGRDECELNALHGCIVQNNNIEDQLKMINCLMRGYSTDVKKCAESLEIDIRAAEHCKESRLTADILRDYATDTDAIDISFVPSIAIDGNFDRWEQRDILYNFETIFCKKYKEKFNLVLKNCP